MKKRIINSAVFFTILYWLAVFLAQRQSRFLSDAGGGTWLLLAGGSLLLILLAKPLLPVFDLVLALTARVGSVIFALITAVVFFVMLTPISLAMRLAGKKFMQRHFDAQRPTYYEPWQVAEDISKQF
jgi:hypothetical protein